MPAESGPSDALRLRDGGPRYAETPADPYAPDSPLPAEPFNAVTAALFVGIVGYWAARVWGRWRRFPFVTACLPVLLAGGVGGTLYHATRTRFVYFLMDVIPISLIGLGAAVFLTVRLGRSAGRGRVFGVAVGVLAVYALVNGVLFRMIDFGPGNLRINLSYATLAVVVLIPIGVVLVRTNFRHGAWVGVGLGAFAVAWFCRLVDNTGLSTLPMGTHWLWHIFGAAATHALAGYFYLLEWDWADGGVSRTRTHPGSLAALLTGNEPGR